MNTAIATKITKRVSTPMIRMMAGSTFE